MLSGNDIGDIASFRQRIKNLLVYLAFNTVPFGASLNPAPVSLSALHSDAMLAVLDFKNPFGCAINRTLFNLDTKRVGVREIVFFGHDVVTHRTPSRQDFKQDTTNYQRSLLLTLQNLTRPRRH